MNLLNRLSKENQTKIFDEAIKYPNTWESFLKELNGGYFTGLTIACATSIYEAVYHLEPFDMGKFMSLFNKNETVI